MERISIEAVLREKTGKEVAKKIRRLGEVPGIVYGKNTNLPVKLSIAALKTLKGISFSASTIIDLKLPGAKDEETQVLVKCIQYHPVTDKVIHLDFMRVSLQEKIRVNVPLVFKGEAKGVKEGGILEQIVRSIEIEGLPLDIPEKIEVDVSDLIVGRSLHVGDIKVPANVRVVTSAAETAVTVVMHVEEAIEAPAADGAAPTEPEVIKEKKEGAEGEEGAEKPGDKAGDKGADKAAPKAAPKAAAKPAAKPEKK